MPAKSVKQRRFMAMCEHGKIPDSQCPDMSKEQMHDFATTKEKGLPKKAQKVVHHSPAMLQVDRHKIHTSNGSTVHHKKCS
jgi:hypothetical protein